jgi:uncharacterized phage protein gp47/JayE
MALNIPDTAQEVEQRAKTDVRRALPDSNPFLKNSVLGAIIISYANRVFEFYLQLKEAVKQALPDTATNAFLERWAAIFGKNRQPATRSTGNVIAGGTTPATIANGTTFASSDGLVYESTSAVDLVDNNVSVTLERSGQTVTATTTTDHNLASNILVTISGAAESEYNGTFEIIVTETDEFTYTIVGTPTTPDSGSADYTSVPVPLQSVDFGADQNQLADTPLTLQSPITNVNNVANVDLGELAGGTDQQTDEELREVLLNRIQNPVANFNDAAIEEAAFTVPGVTRVFIESAGTQLSNESVTLVATSLPGTGTDSAITATTSGNHGFEDFFTTTITGASPGDYNVTDARMLVKSTTEFVYLINTQPVAESGAPFANTTIGLGVVRIYFMRDNDESPIPTGTEITDVQDAVNAIAPANTSFDNIRVEAPVGVTQDFDFSSLTPNTSTMQSAVDANLDQFFSEETSVSTNVDEDAYRAAIFNTIDPDTGDRVTDFSLTTPSGDIIVAPGEIAILGLTSYT